MPKPVTIHLRVPELLYEAIQRVAENDRRSINTTCVALLERSLPSGLLDATRADLVLLDRATR